MLRAFGHENGTKSVRKTVETCTKLGIKISRFMLFNRKLESTKKLKVDTLMSY